MTAAAQIPAVLTGQPPASPSRRLRIAIIPAAFDPRLNYQENIFARTLHEMGHEVTVFTSKYGSGGEIADWPALDRTVPFRIVRSNRVWKWRRTQMPWDWTMRSKIRAFDPQMAFALAPNHGLGMRWVRHLPEGCRLIAGFSDLQWHRGFVMSWLKRRWGRSVIRRAWKVITATEETQRMVSEWGGAEAAGKIEQTGLSFRPEALEGGVPPPAAAALAARVRKLIVSVTRILDYKQLDVLFKSVERYLAANLDAGFVMAGFDNGLESERLRAMMAASPCADRCVALPMLNSGEIGGLFRISTCSVWSLVSIGIYHSLHCGCPVLVRQGQDARHLLVNPAAGAWYADLDSIDVVLPEVLNRPPDRAAVSAFTERFHTDKLLSRLLSEARPGEAP